MKNKLLILALAFAVTFTFGTRASAGVVQLCYTNSHGDVGCCWASGSCASINCPPHWTCADWATVAASITTTSSGGATITANGVTIPIASEAFMRQFQQLTRQYAQKNANKAEIERKLDALWKSPSSWKVTQHQLEQFAKETGAKIGGATGGTSGQ
ncbi:MAG TPA: hypothetical protein VFD13_00755 [Candidatus Kapabacteria bacterium]|nr:hypothetical protein [Candidatus Kapabacteria bacterium]